MDNEKTFKNASQCFQSLNSGLVLLPKDSKLMGKGSYTKCGVLYILNIHETTHRDSIQDPKCPKSGAALGGSYAGTSQGSARPVVRITSHRVRLLDKDNLYRGAKALLDALRYAGAISGDSESEIDYQARQIKVAHLCEEKTVIEIDYAG